MKAYIQFMRERGLSWIINRSLYSLKLKTLRLLPFTEGFYEKKIPPIRRVDLFQTDVSALKAFLQTLPEDMKEGLTQDADLACEGKIKGFSSCVMDYGRPIDWQMNPLTGHFTDNAAKWYRIPDFDPKRGDIKAIWEISRFSHFFLLARAYLLTADTKYYKAFSEQLSDWLEQNPYSYGANFKCGQECALRMLACLMVYPVFRPELTPEDEENVKELVARCYKKILSNFFYAYKCQDNNHALSELAGMIAGAWCTEDPKRLHRAYGMLEKAIVRQFSPDGGYMQKAFNYQRVALQDLEAVLSMSKITGIQLSDQAQNRILSSVLQMYQCQDTSGDMPNYGSNDGALVFPVTVCGYRDFTPCINTVHALLTGKRLYEAGLYDEELLWMSLQRALPLAHIQRQSSRFDDSGLYTLRTDGFWLMLVAAKKIGHMDQNHLDLWVNGENVCCDSGTYSYAEPLGKELRATKGHNTVLCDGKRQTHSLGSFASYGQPKRTLMEWSENRITTESRFVTGYIHRRTVSLLENGLEILDEVTNSEGIPTEATALFHTPLTVKAISETEALLGGKCILKTQESLKNTEAKRSLYYLQYEDISCVEINLPNGRAVTKILMEKNEGETQND